MLAQSENDEALFRRAGKLAGMATQLDREGGDIRCDDRSPVLQPSGAIFGLTTMLVWSGYATLDARAVTTLRISDRRTDFLTGLDKYPAAPSLRQSS